MICFVVAMEKEANPLLQNKEVEVLSKLRYGNAVVYEAKAFDKPFLLCVSGVGKCFAAASISLLAAKYPGLEAIINVGIAGSLEREKAPLLSALIASDFVQHDFDTSPFGDEVGQLPGINLVRLPSSKAYNALSEAAASALGLPVSYGIIASGDQFIADESKAKEIRERFGAVSIDMESAAFAQLAYVNGIPFSTVRVISDTGKKGEYEKYAVSAAETACKIALNILKNS